MDKDTAITFDELFSRTGREPDSLFDRWMAGTLDERTEEAVVGHLLGSSFARDEAMLDLLVQHGAARAQSGRTQRVKPLEIAVRFVQGALEVLQGSIRPLALAGVAVRSRSAAAATSRSFAVDSLGAAARVHVQASATDRFLVSLEGASEVDTDEEWQLLGEGGRMVTADSDEDGTVRFTTVQAGTWHLVRDNGDASATSLALRLEVN